MATKKLSRETRLRNFARRQGMNCGSLFMDVLFQMPWFNQADVPFIIQADGTLSGYIARRALTAFCLNYTPTELEQKMFVAECCSACDAIIIEETTPQNGYFKQHTTALEKEVLASPAMSQREIADREKAYREGRFAASEKIWQTRQDQRESKDEELGTVAMRAAFITGLRAGISTISQEIIEDFHATPELENLREEWKTMFKNNHPDMYEKIVTSTFESEWKTGVLRGFISVWDHVFDRDVSMKELREITKPGYAAHWIRKTLEMAS